ncbi:NAD(P)-dependent oxidoreductase [Thalassospira lucentensis]|uniref:3-hydroxyisobutyrate dehydrogenase n=1 Tax=Thalassospira lucentensis TaxID=168935 RepID=A0A358HXG6_9PROT|nr:NAD(P)-dependent oxidoreductase [Thalassospira lucentensis]HBU99865.1 3-hydroxyisobutyrate dehydrogenase [Thalassospira lucentensis]HCW68670.1 3-hydroxyisobutyrate dehydrogenase [Thalassospira lucentensis]
MTNSNTGVNGAIGVIGLGNMGLGMVRTLVREGFAVIGFDLSGERQDEAARAGAAIVASQKELFKSCDTIILSLPTAAHVTAVLTGEGGLADGDGAPRLVIDTTTSEPDVTRNLDQILRPLGHILIDAPVSGGQAGANSGQLTMMVGGSDADFAKAMPVLTALGGKITHVGPVGAGHAVKIVNNMLVAAHLLTMSEAIRLGTAAGVEVEHLISALNAGSGRSAISEVNYPKWVMNGAFDSGFTMGLMRKDMRLAMALAAQKDVAMPVSELAGALWAKSADAFADDADFNRITEFEMTTDATGTHPIKAGE